MPANSEAMRSASSRSPESTAACNSCDCSAAFRTRPCRGHARRLPGRKSPMSYSVPRSVVCPRGSVANPGTCRAVSLRSSIAVRVFPGLGLEGAATLTASPIAEEVVEVGDSTPKSAHRHRPVLMPTPWRASGCPPPHQRPRRARRVSPTIRNAARGTLVQRCIRHLQRRISDNAMMASPEGLSSTVPSYSEHCIGARDGKELASCLDA